MSSRTVSYGVEFEFAVALVMDPSRPCPDPSETRTIRFHPTEEDIDDAYWVDDEDDGTLPDPALQRYLAFEPAVHRHIAKTLATAGFPIDEDCLNVGNAAMYEICGDGSIRDPKNGGGYEWIGVEVKTPALLFGPGENGLDAIKRLCSLLTDTYVLSTDPSTGTGLHVHIGLENFGYSHAQTRNLAAFFYQFEPLFDSLHPGHRLYHDYGHQMRERCKFVVQFEKDYGRRPEPSEVIFSILHEEETTAITQAVTDVGGSKFSTYNFGNIELIELGAEVIPTLEFRQHEGTLDGERIVAWIETLAGVVGYVQKLTLKDLVALLRVGHSRGQTFTIIDLLDHMGLEKSADFYKCRLSDHSDVSLY